jgi:hypothetical protein
MPGNLVINGDFSEMEYPVPASEASLWEEGSYGTYMSFHYRPYGWGISSFTGYERMVRTTEPVTTDLLNPYTGFDEELGKSYIYLYHAKKRVYYNNKGKRKLSSSGHDKRVYQIFSRDAVKDGHKYRLTFMARGVEGYGCTVSVGFCKYRPLVISSNIKPNRPEGMPLSYRYQPVIFSVAGAHLEFNILDFADPYSWNRCSTEFTADYITSDTDFRDTEYPGIYISLLNLSGHDAVAITDVTLEEL